MTAALTRFLADARKRYADQPKTVTRLVAMADAVRACFPDLPAARFRGPEFKRVREHLTAERACKRTGRPLSRRYVNHLLSAVKQCWRWLLSEDLVPADCVGSVAAVERVRKGKGGRETRRVLPLRKRGNRIAVAISDPSNTQALDEVKFQTSMSIEPIVVEDDKLSAVLTRALERSDTTLKQLIDETRAYKLP